MTLWLSFTINATDDQPQLKHVWHNSKNTRHLIVRDIILEKVDRLGQMRWCETLHSWGEKKAQVKLFTTLHIELVC